MKNALIISGGEYSKINQDLIIDYVIACDKGVEYAERLGIRPDLVMGDFDSYEGDIHECFPDVLVETFPVMKDDTDTMLAIKKALSLGCGHIIIACGFGGRMDHLMSNIQSLMYIAEHGAVGEMISDNDCFRTLSAKEGALSMQRREGYSLSIYSLTDISTGVSIRGALYDVENIELTNAFPLGHGNSFRSDKVEISLKSGILLIIESKIEPGAHA